MKQRKPINKVNKERRERNFIKYYGSEERVRKIKLMPCLICRYIPSDNVHTKSKAAGGTYKNVVPLCNSHHQELHRIGQITFQEKYNIDLEEEAILLYELLGDESTEDE